jgi:hypothetical protein
MIMYNHFKNVDRSNVPLENKCGQVIAELIGHSELKIVHEQKRISTVKSTINDIKCVSISKKK